MATDMAAPFSPMGIPHGRKFLIFGAMALRQFLALLDIQIVAASLNEVQAGLSAGPDEISWVQTAYLVPVFLGRIRGYNSLEIGTTVFVVDVSQVVGTVIATRLSQRIDQRFLIALGLAIFALSLWLVSEVVAEWGFGELLVPQLARELAVMICIVLSVNMVALPS